MISRANRKRLAKVTPEQWMELFIDDKKRELARVTKDIKKKTQKPKPTQTLEATMLQWYKLIFNI